MSDTKKGRFDWWKFADDVLAGDVKSAASTVRTEVKGRYGSRFPSAREIDGLRKSDAKFKRKASRLADELANHIAKGAQYRYEINRLERLLVYIYGEDDVVAIRKAIGNTIPNRLSRMNAVTAPSHVEGEPCVGCGSADGTHALWCNVDKRRTPTTISDAEVRLIAKIRNDESEAEERERFRRGN